jgi:hypothetical protein
MPSLELALAGQVLLWLIVVAMFAASGQASIFHPLTVYLAFHGVVFVVRPILIQYLHFDSVFDYMIFNPPGETIIKTLAVSSVALLVFSAAILLLGRYEVAGFRPQPPPFSPVQVMALVATTLLLLPLVAYSIFASNSGAVTGENQGGVYVMTGASGYTAEAQNMAGPLICLWLVATRFSRIGLLPLIVFVGYRSYCGWARWTIVLLFLALALVYAWQKCIRWLPLWSVVVAVPLFLLFQTLGHNRGFVQDLLLGKPVQPSADATMTSADKAKQKYDTQEFANFDYLCYVVWTVPDLSGGYTYGSQYLELFTEPIPRKLWPSKPVGAPVALVDLNEFGNFNGLTVSLPGDGWLSGGWLGLTITMGLAGAMLGRAHRWFWANSTNNLAALFYLVGLAMIPQWFRDGGISISKFLLWNWLPLIIWMGFTWLLGHREVPGYSVVLQGGARVRLLDPEIGIKPATARERATHQGVPAKNPSL